MSTLDPVLPPEEGWPPVLDPFLALEASSEKPERKGYVL